MANGTVISCPTCQKKFKGKGNLEGKKIKCPLCAAVFVVPGEKAVQATASPAAVAAPAGPDAAPAPASAPLKFADEEDDNDHTPYGVTEINIAPRCPNCAQLMADEKAFICLFCGYNTLTREVGKTQKTLSHTPMEILAHLFPGIAVALTASAFIIGITYYSVVLPYDVYRTKLAFLDHESLRMWFTVMALGIVWGCGTYSYKRLVVAPLPPPKIKDK